MDANHKEGERVEGDHGACGHKEPNYQTSKVSKPGARTIWTETWVDGGQRLTENFYASGVKTGDFGFGFGFGRGLRD